jgi:aminotransferase class V
MLMRAGVGIAALRRQEFTRLDRTGCTYLDYAGAALYPESLVRRDARQLATQVTGNPHSESAPSRKATASLDQARALTLGMLDADSRDYEVIFTPNASGALRICGRVISVRVRLAVRVDGRQSQFGERDTHSRFRGFVGVSAIGPRALCGPPSEWPRAPAMSTGWSSC